MKISEVKGKLKVGDWVRTTGDGQRRCVDYFTGEIGEIDLENDKFFVWQNQVDRYGMQGVISSQSKNYKYSWEISFSNPNDIEILSNQINKTIMTTIKEFAKNILLSKEEKLLRKHGLKNDCGDYTQDAKDLVINRLITDNEKYLLEIAEKKEAEETKK